MTVTETFELGSFRTDDREEAIGALVSANTFRDRSKTDIIPQLTDRLAGADSSRGLFKSAKVSPSVSIFDFVII